MFDLIERYKFKKKIKGFFDDWEVSSGCVYRYKNNKISCLWVASDLNHFEDYFSEQLKEDEKDYFVFYFEGWRKELLFKEARKAHLKKIIEKKLSLD